jgi:hypothetical protein
MGSIVGSQNIMCLDYGSNINDTLKFALSI